MEQKADGVNKIIVTVGIQSSGKSTWAREKFEREPGKWVLVDKDSLRKLLHNGKWSKKNEQFVIRVQEAIICAALEDGLGVIVHDMNFGGHVERLRQLADKYGAQFEVKEFHVDLDEAIKRDLERGKDAGVVGEKVIRSAWNRFVKPPAPKVPYDETLQDAVIVDLDGTLAEIGNRSPYDAARCEQDGFHEDVWEAVLAFVELRASKGRRPVVVLMSGRESKDRAPTERWLQANGVTYDMLFMRATGDNRKDSIVKKELYERHIKGVYNLRAVWDDRSQVVEVWRNEIGVRCFAVADGDF